MNYIRKGISILLISLILLMPAFGIVKASPDAIYETSSKSSITSGAVLEKITRFTTEGWLSINVLRVDLSNPNIKVDTMSNKDSIKNLTNAKTLAQSKGAVAAINAGFFNWMKDSGSGYPDGPIVESGKITTASSEYNKYSDSMATFSISNLNELLYNYWKTDISLVVPNGNSVHVTQYNKPSSDYTDITVLDRRWSANSIGVSPDYPDMVEMVVANGKVTEIRQGQPALPIPQNGFIVETRQDGGNTLSSNFKVGDSVNLNIVTNPDWNKMKMSVTGSAILIKDGQIPQPFSMDIPGRNPRTAIGSTQDGKQLVLVTADGRQKNSIGMTQLELAQFMQGIGVYNAINLDGGGSTTMVARTPGTGSLEVSNSPSDGMPRGVATAVGIFSIAPTSALDGLIIDTTDKNMFVNTSRTFTVKGIDKYLNPTDIDTSQIQWSVSGVDGIFKGNTFYPQSTGQGKIKAAIGSVSAEYDISVLDSPVQLQLDQKALRLSTSQSVSLSVKGVDKSGYSAGINPADVSWAVNGNIGSFNQGIFTAFTQGTGYIDASIGNVHAYCAVAVASDTSSTRDTFESLNGSFTASPAGLPGKYELSSEQKHSGNSSGKLSYDFTSLEGTRAAYFIMSGGGLSLDPNTTKIGLWVYNTHVNPNWLRVEIYDSSGKKYMADFAKNLDWTGWKYVEASLSGISSPSKLTRIYLVQVSPVADSGYIYMDDLVTSVASSYPTADLSQLPQDTAPVDDANQSITYQKSSDSFRFSVFGESRPAKNLLEKVLTLRLGEKINSYLDASAFVGNSSHDIVTSVKTKVVSTNTGYKSFDIMNSRFIQLDMSKSGLRTSSSSQWQWFMQQLDSAGGDNVFIFLADSPKAFNDSAEGRLFQDTLVRYRQSTSKNVWVFYKGDQNTSFMDRGIKYITSAGFDVQGLSPDNTGAAMYILVTVRSGSVTFEFKSIL